MRKSTAFFTDDLLIKIKQKIFFMNAVMLLNVLNHTHTTLTESVSTSSWSRDLNNLVKLCHAENKALQLLLFNKKYLVSISHQLMLITFLFFVHTAHCYYWLNDSVKSSNWLRKIDNNHSKLKSWSNLII